MSGGLDFLCVPTPSIIHTIRPSIHIILHSHSQSLPMKASNPNSTTKIESLQSSMAMVRDAATLLLLPPTLPPSITPLLHPHLTVMQTHGWGIAWISRSRPLAFTCHCHCHCQPPCCHAARIDAGPKKGTDIYTGPIPAKASLR